MLNRLVDLEYKRNLHPIEVGLYKKKIYLDLFKPNLKDSSEKHVEKMFYTTIAREPSYSNEGLTNMLKPYYLNGYLKKLGLTITEVLNTPYYKLDEYNNYLLKTAQDEYGKMEDLLGEHGNENI